MLHDPSIVTMAIIAGVLCWLVFIQLRVVRNQRRIIEVTEETLALMKTTGSFFDDARFADSVAELNIAAGIASEELS